jgi:small GTP-binding protein
MLDHNTELSEETDLEPQRGGESTHASVPEFTGMEIPSAMDTKPVGRDGTTPAVRHLLRARESLIETLKRIEKRPDDQVQVGSMVADLEGLLAKLEARQLEIAAFGLVGRGKSSVLNALAGQPIFEVGLAHGTTRERAEHTWKSLAVEGTAGLQGLQVVLVDTPGLDELHGREREMIAHHVAKRADLVLVVVWGELVHEERWALEHLRDEGKPVLVVLNQVDRYGQPERQEILNRLQEQVRGFGIGEEDVVAVAAAPAARRVRMRRMDGQVEEREERPPPEISRLDARIQTLLEAEGETILTLNTLLSASEIEETVTAARVDARDGLARQLIWKYALAKGLAVALNPIPIADLAGGAAVDVVMIHRLAELYQIPLTQRSAMALARDVSMAMGAVGALQLAGRLAWSGLKGILGGTTIATGGLAAPLTALGYAAAGLAQAAAAAFASYIVGRSAKIYLQQGGQWGPRGMKRVVQEMIRAARRESVLDQLRNELEEKLKGKPLPRRHAEPGSVPGSRRKGDP